MVVFVALTPHAPRSTDAIYLTGVAVGGVLGIYLRRRFWWVGLLPLAAGIGLGFLAASIYPHSGVSYNGGDWSTGAIILVVSLWAGLIATITELVVIVVRIGMEAARPEGEPTASS